MKKLITILFFCFSLSACAQTVKSVWDRDSTSKTKVPSMFLLNNYKYEVLQLIKANGTTFYKNSTVIGTGTQADPFGANPDIIIQRGTSAQIKANAKEGQMWYNTETHTMIFHNGYGLRSINTSNFP